jgi:hypothetical protein
MIGLAWSLRIEVLHQENIARPNFLCTHEALSYPQRPEPVSYGHEEYDQHDQRQPELPCRLD